MKICITLDDVLRAKSAKMAEVYKKYIDDSINFEDLDFSSGDYEQIFKFDSLSDYNQFLYTDYAYEIFGCAPISEPLLDKKLNLWILAMNDCEEIKEPVEVILTSTREYNASIGYTYFFISKMAPRARKIYLPTNSSKVWDVCDILITADKTLLSEERPKGKTIIKINAPYNKDLKADYEYKTLTDFLDDDDIMGELQNKLNQNKTNK